MFALEIDFRDGISPPETILVRRSNAIVGSSELAHVVVEGAASSLCELRLIRGLGREFSCVPVRRPGQAASAPPFLEGAYSGEADLRLGNLSFHVTALDIDLNLIPDEFPDRAAVRILRRAALSDSPLFPAAAVLGAQPMYISFPPEQPLLVGRSRKCGLRLDASDVSGEHARIGMEEDMCWVEDLGSTNGTFVGTERISGRRRLQPGEVISIGSEFTIMPVLSPEDVTRLNSESKKYPDTSTVTAYPCLVTKCETIRPLRYPMKPHQRITVGRDPANDIWTNYPHISRNHVELIWTGEEIVRVIDRSSNGSYIKGQRLPRGRSVELPMGLTVLDLCSGVELAVCCSEEDEHRYFHAENGEVSGKNDTDLEVPLPPEEQSADQIRAVLERAAGLAEAVPNKGKRGSSSNNVFSRLAQRQSNLAQDHGGVASQESGKQALTGAVPSGFGALSSGGSSGNLDQELSEFERYQLSRRLSDEQHAQEFEQDYALLAEAEFDEEVLDTGHLGGTGRLLVMGFVAILVIIILLLCVSFISGPYFISFE